MKSRIPKIHRTLSLAFLTAGLWTGVAHAQSPEDAILDGDNGVGLIEKKPTEEKVLDDPDPKQIEALNKRREAIETFINTFQEKFSKERVLEVKLGKKLAAISSAFGKLIADALAAGDDFAVKHNPLVNEYRSALQEDRGPDVKKAAAEVAKARANYASALSKLEKRVDKVKADFAKIEPDLTAAEGAEAEPTPEADE